MDLTVLLVEILFGALFVSSVVGYVRRRDALSRDVMLIFGSVGMLFGVIAAEALFGGLPDPVSGAALAGLLAQPVLTLRLANQIRPISRVVRIGAFAAYAVTAWPLVFVPLEFAAPLVLAGLGVFVVNDLLAAFYLARESRRRVGSARVRLGAAAWASAMLASALLLTTVGGSLTPLRDVAGDFGRLMGLAAAGLYVVAFMPPQWMRRLWNAVTTFEFTQHLTDVAPDAEDPAVWERLADVARRTTGARAVLVLVGGGRAPSLAASADGDAAATVRAATVHEHPTESPDGRSPLKGGLGKLATEIRAPFTSVLGFTLAGGEPGSLVLLRERPSLFASDDHAILQQLITRATVFAERIRAVVEQAALAQRLAMTVRALEHASQAKSDFLASMSHELRTPLSAIIGFSALMRDEPMTGDRRSVPDEWIEHVHRSGGHLLALINDVLDLTKIEAGRIDLEREPFELASLLGESVEGLRPLAARKSISVELSAEPGEVSADRGRLRQVVYNLLSNAIKFTPEGGSIRIESAWSGDDARIAVTDSGIGIAPADLPHIFEEFRQVGDLKAREAGTGLGLALSRRLAEAHGGTITATSEPGNGSRFELLLPAARARVTSEPTPALATRNEAAGARVLVIEDDPGAVRLLRTYLESEGYSVVVATDGEAGIAAARSTAPDAIILDVLLPGLDGWEVLRRLKADREVRDLPVVVVTVVDERNVAMSLGAVDYFLKPVSPDALLARLAQYTFTTKVKQGPVRVLAIDDDPAARELVAGALRPEGFEVIAAASGREALELARQSPPDLVICDLLMPDMDGYEVVNRLQEEEATRDATILILTGHDLTPEDRERLNGKVAQVFHKGEDPRIGFARWMRRAATASKLRRGRESTPAIAAL